MEEIPRDELYELAKNADPNHRYLDGPDQYPDEITALRTVAKELAGACEAALSTLRVAVAAGLEGFTADEEMEIVEHHVTIAEIKSALHKYREMKGGE